MDKAQFVQLFICLFVLPFIVLPAVGAGALRFGFQLANLPKLEYVKGWKAYLASCCYGFLLLIPVGIVMRDSSLSDFAKQLIQIGVFCGTQFILVPLLIRNFTRKALGVIALAVLGTNIAGFVFYLLQVA